MKNALPVFIVLFFFASFSFAQTEEVPPPWTHESELGIVTVSGNTESESYSGKQLTTYRWDKDSLSLNARYLQTKDGSQVTAKSWTLGLRYEKTLSDLWSLFVAEKAESDPFAGYIQQDSTDLGAKYLIRKTDGINWFAELGLTDLRTYTVARDHEYDLSSRFYTEVSKTLEKNLSLKYWVEYIRSLRRSYVYFVNTEISLNVMLNKQFSLKTGYLLKYHNSLIPPGDKYSDTSFTTSLVAHF